MPWPSYVDFYVGYSLTAKNAYPARIWDDDGDQDNQYSLVPNFTSGNLYDGYIVFCARNDKALHEIFQETLDTPVGVGSQPPDKG